MRKIILVSWYLIFLFSFKSYCQESDQAKVDTSSFTYFMSLAQSQIDKQLSNWKLKDLEGNEYELSDYAGDLILLEFWGTGCGACVKAARDVCFIDSVYKPKGLEVIGIESDGRSNLEQIKNFKQDYNFNYLTLIGGKEISEKYRVRAYPTFFLIDKSGKIIYAHIGFFYGNKKDELITIIERNL